MNEPSLISTPTPEEFQISRVFDAPRPLVFRVWTDPVHLARWWGPASFENSVTRMELRPGGHFRVVMRSPEGVEFPINGEYREIVAPERIVMSLDCTEHPDEWHALINPEHRPGENPVGEILETVSFEALGTQTRLTVRVRFATAALRATMGRTGMNDGWTESLDRLASLLDLMMEGRA